MAAPKVTRARSSGRVFLAVALASFVASMVQDVGFMAPAAQRVVGAGAAIDAEVASARPFAGGVARPEPSGAAYPTQRQAFGAALVLHDIEAIGQRVLHAMGAGAVASIIQAALSAVGEPIINRVLVQRMKVMDAVRAVKPSMMLEFFKTTLATNFLKFPFFEAINAFCAHLPISPHFRGFVTGFVFTSATLPVTNYRYRKSMQLEVNWGNLYEAYLPTVIRDIAYGICRNYSTIWLLGMNSAWKATSPSVLFVVVILGCLGSAPFNEWRGFLLQAKGQEMSFSDFFKPANFIRSTSLGALKQGLALAVGYWCAPPATRFVNQLITSIRP